MKEYRVVIVSRLLVTGKDDTEAYKNARDYYEELTSGNIGFTIVAVRPSDENVTIKVE